MNRQSKRPVCPGQPRLILTVPKLKTSASVRSGPLRSPRRPLFCSLLPRRRIQCRRIIQTLAARLACRLHRLLPHQQFPLPHQQFPTPHQQFPLPDLLRPLQFPLPPLPHLLLPILVTCPLSCHPPYRLLRRHLSHKTTCPLPLWTSCLFGLLPRYPPLQL